jgi:hypothetical protein
MRAGERGGGVRGGGVVMTFSRSGPFLGHLSTLWCLFMDAKF